MFRWPTRTRFGQQTSTEGDAHDVHGRPGDRREGRGALRVVGGTLALGAAVGIVIGLALPVTSSPRFQVVDTNVHLPDPTESLEGAQAAAPYEVRLPSKLPAGTKLEHVNWAVDGERVDVDLWFALPGGGRLHIWQTNHPLGHTFVGQVGQVGQATTIAGREWTATLLHSDPEHWDPELDRLELSTRFDDGITLALYADPSDAQSLAEVAASLA